MSGQPPPLVICGPSGVGKSVLIKHLCKVFPDKFGFSVSHTTRGPRPGEEDGVHYHFADLETMKKDVEAGKFIESAMVHGNMYGTSKEAVDSVGRAGKICILDIDVQGAQNIRASGCFEQVRFVFLYPPSMQELERRLRGRGTETEEKVLRRLAGAQREMDFAKSVAFFDHTFVLDGLSGGNVPPSVHEFCAMLRAWYPTLGGLGDVGVIRSVRAREIIDSCGHRALEVDLCTSERVFRAAVPGCAEASSALDAVEAINSAVGPRLIGMDAARQAEIDRLLTEAQLSASACMAVSMAVCRAGAAISDVPLYEHIARLAGQRTDSYTMPVPALNVIDGGNWAGNRLGCRELLILPIGAGSFKEAMAMGAEVYHTLKGVIRKRYGQDACNVGDRGGFAPTVHDNDEALEVLMQAIQKSGHAGKVKLSANIGAPEFYNAESRLYDLDFKNAGSSAETKNAEQLMSLYNQWFEKYPFGSIEDPFDHDDWEAQSKFVSRVGQDRQIVGGDSLLGDPSRMQKAVEVKACNALLLKASQIGSVTKAIEASCMAQRAGWSVVVSHHSGETEDTFLADLAVGLHTGHIRAGAPCRSEWLSKYNELIRIEEELGSMASFARASSP